MRSVRPGSIRQDLLQLAAQHPRGELLLAPAELGAVRRPRPVPGALFEHVPRCPELAAVVVGEARVVTAAESFHLTQDKLLLIDAGVLHAEVPTAGSRGHVIFWCMFDGTAAMVAQTIYSPPAGLTTGYLQVLRGRTNLQSIVAAIRGEWSSHEWGRERAIRGLLDYLFCILVRRLDRPRPTDRRGGESLSLGGGPTAWPTVQAALEYCRANYHRGVGAMEVAKAVGYSPTYLSRLFSSHLGESLSAHLQGLRMSQARVLLEDSNAAIRDIAAAVGYADPAHFTRAFGRAVGLSPTAYRRALAAG
jgi:AraC-like DNA-binding protein